MKRVALAAVTLLLGVLGCAVWMGTQPMVTARVPPVRPGAVAPQVLEAHVRMLAQAFHPRDVTHPENLDRVAAYISQRFGTLGYAVEEQTWTYEGKTYRNVVASRGAATLPHVVVGAHYDSWHPRPGADDNASGVAALLELAALLKDVPTPDVRLELVAWSLEEPPVFRTPYTGSAVHADALAKRNANVRAAISVETVGYFTNAPDTQHFPVGALNLFYPSTGNFLALVSNTANTALCRRGKAAVMGATDLPVFSFPAPVAIPGIDWSDHRSYWGHGYPAVMVTDSAPNRNPNYHEPTDTPETLDYVSLSKVVHGVFGMVLDLAAAPL